MLHKCIFNREVNPDFPICFVVEMALEFLYLVVIGIVMVFEVFSLGGRDLHFLAADKLHGLVRVLVASGIYVALFVREKLTLHYAFGNPGAS
jgi:hypothetical protein